MVAGKRRSQLQTRAAAEERLAKLVREAMHVAKRRRATAPTKASKERRLETKKQQSRKKEGRRMDVFE